MLPIYVSPFTWNINRLAFFARYLFAIANIVPE